MKNRLFALLGMALLVAGGVIVFERVTLGRLSVHLHEQAEAINAGYAALINDDLHTLTQEYTLSTLQKRMVERINEISTTFHTAQSLEEKIRSISMLQMTLMSFITSVTPVQTVVKDPHFIELQKEMSERGDMRALLQEYNNTALRWNNAVQSNVGSLTSRSGEGSNTLLPYLRFDGEQEFVTIVEL